MRATLLILLGFFGPQSERDISLSFTLLSSSSLAVTPLVDGRAEIAWTESHTDTAGTWKRVVRGTVALARAAHGDFRAEVAPLAFAAAGTAYPTTCADGEP